LSQPPQCAVDVFVSTQPPPQAVSPVEQPAAHCPAWQTCPAGQAWPQLPQLAALLVRLAQVPLHSISPVAQPQCPPMQGVPAGHAVPQAPQLVGLVSRSTHWPEHAD
jgi:hypothetical protein